MGPDSDPSHPAASSDTRETETESARYNHPTKGGEHMAKGTGMKKEKKKPKKKK
jgi:hypothetical protein